MKKRIYSNSGNALIGVIVLGAIGAITMKSMASMMLHHHKAQHSISQLAEMRIVEQGVRSLLEDPEQCRFNLASPAKPPKFQENKVGSSLFFYSQISVFSESGLQGFAIASLGTQVTTKPIVTQIVVRDFFKNSDTKYFGKLFIGMKKNSNYSGVIERWFEYQLAFDTITTNGEVTLVGCRLNNINPVPTPTPLSYVPKVLKIKVRAVEVRSPSYTHPKSGDVNVKAIVESTSSPDVDYELWNNGISDVDSHAMGPHFRVSIKCGRGEQLIGSGAATSGEDEIASGSVIYNSRQEPIEARCNARGFDPGEGMHFHCQALCKEIE